MNYQAIQTCLDRQTDRVNTHSHLLVGRDAFVTTVADVFGNNYTHWIHELGSDTPAARRQLAEQMATNTYYTWQARAFGILYGDGTPLGPDNWEAIDACMQSSHQSPDHGWRILQERCRYGTIIRDDYENPGADLGRAGWMRPAFRCDMFLNGFAGGPGVPLATAACGGQLPESLPDYLAAVEEQIRRHQAGGASCIKIAIAYDRDLAFAIPSAADRETVAVDGLRGGGFAEMGMNSPAVRAFQNVVMERILQTAADCRLPVQFHTGLGLLDRSGARFLQPLVAAHSRTQFVLFHGSFPWSDDALGLLHVYRNVSIDLCWLPLISTRRAIRFLLEVLEVGRTSDICWGCDTWTPEESFAALLAARHVVASALETAQQDHGLSDAQVARIADGIFRDNARRIYRFD